MDAAPKPIIIALLASESKHEDLAKWLESDDQFLVGKTLLLTEDVADYLKEYYPPKQYVNQEVIPVEGGDITVAGRAMQGQVDAVIVFQGYKEGVVDVAMLSRACDIGKVPMALNEASAAVILRGLGKKRMAYLIFNPVAGQRDPKQDLAVIYSTLEPAIAVTVILTKRDVDPAQQAKEVIDMIKDRPDDASSDIEGMIIASGGDGTVSAIAGATMGSGIPFGVVPRGTANAFSVALGIPTDVAGACRNILRGNVRVIDGAMCNETPMILLAGIGFEAGMVQNAPRELKDKIGTLAYVLGGVKQFFTQESFECTVQVNGETHTGKVSALTVANVAPPTSVMAQGAGAVIPDDGMLDITVAVAIDLQGGIEAMTKLAAAAVTKNPTDSGTLFSLRAKELTVTCDPPQTLVVDGELLDLNPIKFKVLPNAISVLAPPAGELPAILS